MYVYQPAFKMTNYLNKENKEYFYGSPDSQLTSDLSSL